MPKRLPARWRPESIAEFRAAARRRHEDGVELAGQGRRTGAIYLWGYCAEMTLKAAYFALTGHADADVLGWKTHIFPAIERGRKMLQLNWPVPGQGHNVRAWAELLVTERGIIPGAVYPHRFGREVLACGRRIGLLWSETLRYHKNMAYVYEMTQVRDATEWLLANSRAL
jgi:hypothetical protein